MKNSLRFVVGMILLLALAVPGSRTIQANVARPEALPMLHKHETCRLGGEMSSPLLTTWFPVEVECPICKTKNIFLQWGSYGSYIYQEPSKFQLIFWPHTTGAAWYSCKKCRLTTFIDDFKQIPKDKITPLRQVLEGVSLPPQKARSEQESKDKPPYLELPVFARLVVAEKVYRTLGFTDDEFWSHFYRVMGYFLETEKPAEADEARRKSLAITERLLADKAHEGSRKELLYISGAMKHFLHNDAGALLDFAAAKKLTYANKDLQPENNEGYNEYLSKLIDEYIEMIRKEEKPKA